MRIVQLIDSLDAGGAERMAVNYANALSEKIAFSGIVATRKEGVLKQEIKHINNYAFLERKNKFDTNAIFLASKYIKRNKINTQKRKISMKETLLIEFKKELEILLGQ